MDFIWWAFVKHLFYLLCRFIFHFAQEKLLWPFNGVAEHLNHIRASEIFSAKPENSHGTNFDCLQTCQMLNVVYRRKLVGADMTGAKDFIWYHDRFAPPGDIFFNDPCWAIYTMDKEYVYFVRTPEPFSYYNARRAPFVFMRQFEEAQKVARMPLDAFCAFVQKDFEGDEFKGPVVFYANAARSGSTLLTRMMQVSEEKIVSLGEPDIFTALTIYSQRGLVDQNQLKRLLKAIFKFLCKDQLPKQTYLIKLQSNCTYLVPHIRQVLPSIKHVFTFRKNTKRVLSSSEKGLRGATAGDVIVTLWNLSPRLCCQLINFGGFEYELHQRFKVKDCLDYAILCHVATFFYYHKNRECFDAPLIFYEDIVDDPRKVLRTFFILCEINFQENLIQEALKELGQDSQAGTALARENMKSVPADVMTSEKILYLHTMCDELQIPRIEV